MSKKRYEDDDGRVVADMSILEPRGIAETWFGLKRRGNTSSPQSPEMMSGHNNNVVEPLDKEDRRILIFEAIKMSFKLGMVYVIGFGLMILLLLFLWGKS